LNGRWLIESTVEYPSDYRDKENTGPETPLEQAIVTMSNPYGEDQVEADQG
jgi:hypothetical protein